MDQLPDFSDLHTLGEVYAYANAMALAELMGTDETEPDFGDIDYGAVFSGR